jgi:hypothetical protein
MENYSQRRKWKICITSVKVEGVRSESRKINVKKGISETFTKRQTYSKHEREQKQRFLSILSLLFLSSTCFVAIKKEISIIYHSSTEKIRKKRTRMSFLHSKKSKKKSQ